MPNIASVLKAEIARVARKEVRAETAALRKAVTTHRAQIAQLKREVKTLAQALGRLRKATATGAAEGSATSAPPAGLRFSAKGFATTRRRLEVSAADLGRLFGVSGQTIYHWESGKARPRARHMAGIAALRTMGKRALAARLEALGA